MAILHVRAAHRIDREAKALDHMIRTCQDGCCVHVFRGTCQKASSRRKQGSSKNGAQIKRVDGKKNGDEIRNKVK